jgi:hypothetical protein
MLMALIICFPSLSPLTDGFDRARRARSWLGAPSSQAAGHGRRFLGQTVARGHGPHHRSGGVVQAQRPTAPRAPRVIAHGVEGGAAEPAIWLVAGRRCAESACVRDATLLVHCAVAVHGMGFRGFGHGYGDRVVAALGMVAEPCVAVLGLCLYRTGTLLCCVSPLLKSTKDVLVAWAVGEEEAMTACFLWAAGITHPLFVALLGETKLGWGMLVVQFLGCFTAGRFVSPFLPAEYARAVSWSLPGFLALALLSAIVLYGRIGQQVNESASSA